MSTGSESDRRQSPEGVALRPSLPSPPARHLHQLRLQWIAAALACAALGFAVGWPDPASATTFDTRIANPAGDAEESPAGAVSLNSSRLELVNNRGNQTVGLRWSGLSIPVGARITAAYIQFVSATSQRGATSLTFQGVADDNVAGFTTVAHNISSRPRTGAAATWAPPAWASNEQGTNERTPDLSPLLQEIVSRPGWASGGAVAVVITGTGLRTAYSYDGSRARAPLLHVEYALGDSPPVVILAVTALATPPLTVNASGAGSTDADLTPIATYTFDFGDGTPAVTTTAPASGAQHTYASAGTYTVTLTAKDTGNLTSAPVTRSVTVQADNPPVASLAVTPLATPALTVNASGAGSTDADLTPIATYAFDFGDGTPAVTTAAPASSAQHTYASSGTYTVTLIVTDTAKLSSAPVTAVASVNANAGGGPAIAVYAGYYDTHHPVNPQPKPSPWRGSPGTVFIGTPDNKAGDPPGGGWDTSCMRVDNLTTAQMVVAVSVTIGTHRYALWGADTIPAGAHLVLAQTTFQNFDGSDLNPAGCYGCDPTQCTTLYNATIPVVHVTTGGVTTDYFDNGQVLNTHGVDAAGCPYVGGPLPQTRYDETEAWQQIYPAGQAPLSARAAPTSSEAALSGTPQQVLWLGAPVPNPSRGGTYLRFSTPVSGPVLVNLYDLSGRLVRKCVSNVLEAGAYGIALDLGDVREGIFFVRLSTPMGVRSQKLVLMR